MIHHSFAASAQLLIQRQRQGCHTQANAYSYSLWRILGCSSRRRRCECYQSLSVLRHFFQFGAMLIFWPRLPSPSKAAKESITKDSDGPVPVITIPWLRPSCAWLSQSRATGLSPRRLSQLPKINPTRPVAPTRRRRGRRRAACFRPSRGFAQVNPRPRSRRARPAAIRVKPLSLQAEAPGTARNTGSRAGIYGTVSRSESISSESVSSESVLWPDAATSRGRDP